MRTRRAVALLLVGLLISPCGLARTAASTGEPGSAAAPATATSTPGTAPAPARGTDPTAAPQRQSAPATPPTRPVIRPPAVQPPVLPPPPPLSRGSAMELVVAAPDMAMAQQVANWSAPRQWRLRQRQNLSHLGWVLSVFSVADGSELDSDLTALRAALPGVMVDQNHRYQPLSHGVSYGQALTGWHSQPGCGEGATLGILDTAVEADHPALVGADLVQRSFLPSGVAMPSSDHGTAIAALLLGNGDEGIAGLLPAARLYAAAVFRGRGDDVETDTALLLQALDWLAGEQVPVIAMSLGGPRNQLLEMVLRQLHQRGMRLAAAVGNDGRRAAPRWPAAQPEVLAVTAVDARKRLYRRANRGDEVELAAPGVDLWTARAGGGQGYVTGTSFAVPFVAAALTRQEAAALLAGAEDLGEPGPDPLYGAGLLREVGCL